jgi:integrase
VRLGNGSEVAGCRFSPHSLRATAATLLLGAGVDIKKVQTLLGHKDVKTTMGYYKRRFRTAEGASHEVTV